MEFELPEGFLEDSSLVKVVLNLLLSTTHQEKSGTSVVSCSSPWVIFHLPVVFQVRKVAQDIHSQLGDIDEVDNSCYLKKKPVFYLRCSAGR